MTLRFCLLALFLAFSLPAWAQSLAAQVLDEVNLARTQPTRYAQIVSAQAGDFRGNDGAKAHAEAVAFLKRTRPLPALTWSRGISQAALSHALDLGPRGGRGHTGSGGETPWKRMSRFGSFQGYAGENIEYGHNEARDIVIALIVDNGVSSRMHRKNIFSKNFRVAGVGIAPHANWGSMCVMDFATSYVEAGEERVASRTGFRSIYSGMSFF